jgi:hypothetical protein
MIYIMIMIQVYDDIFNVFWNEFTVQNFWFDLIWFIYLRFTLFISVAYIIGLVNGNACKQGEKILV